MSYLISIFWGGVIFFQSLMMSSPFPHLAALPIIQDIFRGNAPENIGLTQDHLAACPASPNCVLSQDPDSAHQIEPLAYHSDRSTARQILLKVLSVVPGTQIVQQTNNYIRAESVSRIMGFTDDVEFYFAPDQPIIHVRSASRLGESDLGVNRRRIEQIRLALEDLQA